MSRAPPDPLRGRMHRGGEALGRAWFRRKRCSTSADRDRGAATGVVALWRAAVDAGGDTSSISAWAEALRRVSKGRATLLSATVSHRHGRWTVSVLVEAADLHPARRHPGRADADCGGWVGVDRGLAAFVVAATSTGLEVLRVGDPPRPWRAAADRLRHRSRRVSRARRDSVNRKDAVVRLARAHARVAHVRDRFVHEVANCLVNTHDRIALEDLHVTGMMANHCLAAAIADAGWAQFARIVAYKQAWWGGQTMLVDRWFASSKTCSHCRTVVASMPLQVRTFECAACGLTLDRDLNAAVNLATWAEENHARVRDLARTGPGHQRPPRRPPRPRPRHGTRGGAVDVGTPPDPVEAGTSEKDAVPQPHHRL